MEYPPPMREFRRICVYCGSSDGTAEHYRQAARDLGALLARRRIGLVYGGGRVGLMGELADGALEAGGEVFGVIPHKLMDHELGHQGLTELFITDSMHARKAMMAHLSDAFIALPGGWGTLEELSEMTTWAQLNYQHKPVGLLNVEGYFDLLLAFITHAQNQGFIRPIHRNLICSHTDAATLLHDMAEVEIPHLTQWMERP